MSKAERRALGEDVGVPVGRGYIELVRGLEGQCERATDEWLPTAGKKAPECLERLGTLLSLLDRLSSCWWGCSGGNHVVEHLTARGLHAVRAGLMLSQRGFYEEALVMCRKTGEVANLLGLFCVEPGALETWAQATADKRWNDFRPGRVRSRLAAAGLATPFGKDRYGTLSERGVHATPEHVPNQFFGDARPLGPGIFQEAGAILTINELAIAAAFLGLFAARLTDCSHEVRRTISDTAQSVTERVGQVQVLELERMNRELAQGRP